MQFQPMRVFGLLFFVTMPLFMLLGVVNTFAASSGLNKAVTFFEVLSFGSLALVIGLAIWERDGLHFDLRGLGRGAGPSGANRSPNPGGGFSA